ncbi:helix-turn-helix domain-containing protein [Xiamenia xianingshaonis]|uniref:Helix-turn-helix domain-containing protein n=1 Tax=Xiamenia xianingshaonis TaxID=2682776 RepID=A0A9E6SUW8_9ACTN|nr:helix-turn-helix transcriptional regulator [Xiamenia xianingshaonis]NHM14466.1 helix-turn-helix domain-containing protein [Xiamenia xianingshaonis]QTU84940.1 helix-turn-helix transcriptional regulator [Xiamenia xianingshaonis]
MDTTEIKMPRDEFNKMVGERIKQKRIEAGYTRLPLFAEEKLGIKPDTYRRYEMGTVALSLELAWRIADVLEMTLDELVGRTFASKLVISDDLDPIERHILERFRGLEAEDKIDVYNKVEYFIVNLEEGGQTKNE